MANTYLTRTPTGSATQTGTFSSWIKRSKLGGDKNTMISGYVDGSNYTRIHFRSDDSMQIYAQEGGSAIFNKITNRLFRDTSAWYNIVVAFDLSNSTAEDRIKIYINGVRETSFSTNSNPSNTSKNIEFVNSNGSANIGNYASSDFFNGSMSHIHYIDATAYDASAFGETDATTGEWKGKTSPSVTYGTNGFFILKDGNGITDQSGEGNNFTLGGGTLTDLKDNPENVFATMNALSKSLSDVVLSKGNTIIRNDANTDGNVLGTIALGNGKYYWETYKHGGGNTGLGITLASVDGSNHSAVHGSRVNYYQDGYIYQNGFGLSDINTGVTYSDTDIISVSVDTENGTIKFYKNGVLVNNSSQTNSVFTYAQNELIPFWYCSNGGEWRTNLGNGYFGTTAVSSAGTNASENGIFEYAVQPTDATALSTKGLNL